MASNVSSLLILLVAATALLLASSTIHLVTAVKTQDETMVPSSTVDGGEEEYDLGSGRRILDEGGSPRYLSYSMLLRNRTPCNNTDNTGASYYNCNSSDEEANPYRRSCNTITRCARE